jgi:DNA-binding NtrC family response regulator
MEQYCAQNGLDRKTLSSAAEKLLAAQEWPGNVRQLENTLQRAIIMCENGVLEAGDFNLFLPQGKPAPLNIEEGSTGAKVDLMKQDGSFATIDEIEQAAMKHVLAHYDGNTTQAAKALGMAKSTFYRKLKE